MTELYPHQKDAIKKLKTGSILWGGVGSGKSLTAIAYYYIRVCDEMRKPRDLTIITTARKRDTHEWEGECLRYDLWQYPVKVDIDSWNNIEKHADIKNQFVIFDEQRVTGYGPWVKAFLKITRNNDWILLSATPGDRWTDYIPVFIANGFYRNKTDFNRQHVIFSPYVTKYPKIIGFKETDVLAGHRDDILIGMHFKRQTVQHHLYEDTEYDKDLYLKVVRERFDPFRNEPIRDAAGLCYVLRRSVNDDKRKLEKVIEIMKLHTKAIIFYNFNYELNMLRDGLGFTYAEWNGQKHEAIPVVDRWAYLVQYTAGAEGWNCVQTDTIIFFSQNYSYKTMMQAVGRIDRINTAYHDLYYYYLVTKSGIDKAIMRALSEKRDFNEQAFENRIDSDI